MPSPIFDLILNQDEIGWKDLLYNLVETEQMDPWDIDISQLTRQYIQLVKKIHQYNLRISGKVLLAAAILLKIKSAYLIEHDISNLDCLINQSAGEMDEEELFAELEKTEKEKFPLIPRQPQARTRKVSLPDLIDALQRAMVSKRRVLAQQRPVKFALPKKGMDIVEAIRDLYHKIAYYSRQENSQKITFSRLLPPQPGRAEKVYTFIPLLHLETQRQVETEQEKAFAEIYIKLLPGKKA